MQYDVLKFQTPIEVSPLPSKAYGNGCLLNNTRPTHLKGESEFKLQGLIFITKHKNILWPNQWWRSIPHRLDDQNLKWMGLSHQPLLTIDGN
jgi:hypothetical protein